MAWAAAESPPARYSFACPVLSVRARIPAASIRLSTGLAPGTEAVARVCPDDPPTSPDRYVCGTGRVPSPGGSSPPSTPPGTRTRPLTDPASPGTALTGAALTGAELTGAALTGEELNGEPLTGAALSGAALTGAALSGAALAEEALTEEALTEELTGPSPTGAPDTGAPGSAAEGRPDRAALEEEGGVPGVAESVEVSVDGALPAHRAPGGGGAGSS
ncbi:hypothetical protein GCM10009524_58110 [Spirilliplanes yamanashiensis]